MHQRDTVAIRPGSVIDEDELAYEDVTDRWQYE